MKRVVLALLLVSCSNHKSVLQSDAFKPPVFSPQTKVDLTGMERLTLKNGLEVILVPRKSVPSVEVTLAIKAGDNANPLDQAGLSDFTADMLTKGTKSKNAAQIAEATDFVGASLNAWSSDEATYVSCHARSQDFALCLRLIFDVVQNPTFPESEMTLLRQQFVGNIEQAKDTPATLADQHANYVFYGHNDVRGRTMSHASLAKIARSHLVDFHKRWFAPNNAILAVSGDFDRKLIESTFSTWKKKKVPALPKFETPKVGTLKIRVVDKPDATQSTIAIMGPGIPHASPDYYAVKLMNYALGGGGFSSRLMKVVRSEGGKTYGASSRFQADSDAGDFTVSTFTRNAETAATLKLVIGEIEKMQKSGPTSDELDAAKGKVIGGFGLQLETGSDLADQLLLSNIHGLGNDYLSKYPQRMLNVTLDDSKKAAADYLFPTTLVVVGNAKEITPSLTEIGYAPHEIISYLDPVAKE